MSGQIRKSVKFSAYLAAIVLVAVIGLFDFTTKSSRSIVGVDKALADHGSGSDCIISGKGGCAGSGGDDLGGDGCGDGGDGCGDGGDGGDGCGGGDCSGDGGGF